MQKLSTAVLRDLMIRGDAFKSPQWYRIVEEYNYRMYPVYLRQMNEREDV